MPTVVAFTSRSKSAAGRRSLGGAEAPSSRASPSALSGGAVPDRDVGAGVHAAPRRRPEPSPPRRARARGVPAGDSGSASRRPVASVFSAAIRHRAKLSVLAAPIARAASEAVVGDRERRQLVRNGDVDADEALARHRANPRVEVLRRHLDRLVGPLVGQAELGERGGLHRGRPRMGDGLAQDREALRHWRRCYAGARRRRAARAVGRRVAAGRSAGRVVRGLGRLESGIGGGEEVAATVRLRHVVEVVDVRGMRRGLDRRQARVADRGRRQARVLVRVVRRV